ncbi:MAG: hypothetical protein GXP45_05165 [bacterium]|nr:hypothetical protein [bacterium]
MKKHLLVWLSVFYGTVVQLVIFGQLRQDSRFYLVAGVNFLVLVFFTILFLLSQNSPKKQRKNHDKGESYRASKISRQSPFAKRVYYFLQHYLFVIVLVLLPFLALDHLFFYYNPVSLRYFVLLLIVLWIILLKAFVQRKIFFAQKQFSRRSILFVVSLFLLLMFYSSFVHRNMTQRLSVLLSFVLAFIVYIFLIKIFKARRLQRLRDFASIKFYVFGFLIAVIVFVFGSYLAVAKTKRYAEQSWVYSHWQQCINNTSQWFSDLFYHGDVSDKNALVIPDLGLESGDLSNEEGKVLDLQWDSQKETGDTSFSS